MDIVLDVVGESDAQDVETREIHLLLSGGN